MNVLVTGVRSKIARAVIPILIKNGYRVIGVCRDIGAYDNIYGIDLVQADLTEPLLMTLDCQIIIHVAAHVPYNFNTSSFFDSYYSNIISTNNLLNFSIKNNVKKFIFTSSIDVYGEQRDFLVDEYSPLNAISDYGLSKIASENMINAYFNIYGIQYAVFRLSYVYGAGMGSDRVLKKIVTELKCGKEISVYNLENILNIINVYDVANVICSAINGPSGVYNLSHSCTLGEYVEAAKMVLNTDQKVFELNNNKTELVVYSSERLKDVYGWHPSISLLDGISQIVKEG